MAMIELTRDNVVKTIAEHDILFIDFWAEWCAPCRRFAPVFEKAANDNPDIAFAKCNTENEREVAAGFGIRSIPTLAIFRDQILVFKQPGALPAPALESIIEQVRNLDMDKVRAAIEQEESADSGKDGAAE